MSKKQIAFLENGNKWISLLTLLYLFSATWGAWQIVTHSSTSMRYFDQGLDEDNLQNKGAQFLARFDEHHVLLGLLLSPSVKDALHLPSTEEADHAIEVEIPHLHEMARSEAGKAGWWSWLLWSSSLLYAAATIAIHRSFITRGFLFALGTISTVFFVIGISAPAMVIWTDPSIPVLSTKLQFILQHQVRSISSVIESLFTSGHWIVGGLIMLFSIITPVVKSVLTFIATATRSPQLKSTLAKSVHTIGKWSMADVFVAGVLLALFSLKSQEATKTLPCLGLYYFIGYCLLSMGASSLLVHTEFGPPQASDRFPKRLRGSVLGWIFVAVFVLIILGGGFIHQTQRSDVPKSHSAETNAK